ncbi:MAG: hypothetical protein KA807_13850 [Prolixibacteraceae bacterium]|nr:hypothetical protein [Prolixibacteraceae bacterium]
MRNKILNLMKSELIGPSVFNGNPDNELLNESPTKKYYTGVLFPQNTKTSDLDTEMDNMKDIALYLPDNENNNNFENDDNHENIDDKHIYSSVDDDGEDIDPYIIKSKTHLSFIYGLSFSVLEKNFSDVNVKIEAGCYQVYNNGGHDTFQRVPLNIAINLKDIPENQTTIINSLLSFNEDDIKVEILENLAIYNQIFKKNNKRYITLKLINMNKVSPQEKKITPKCFFQNKITVTMNNGTFQTIFDQYNDIVPDHIDEKRNMLYYNHKKIMAIGHSCSALWDNHNKTISTSFMPEYELKPIKHSKIDNTFIMLDIADDSKWCINKKAFDLLADEYEKWIDQKHLTKNSEDYSMFADLIDLNVKQCKQTLKRIKEGITILDSNPLCRKAFQYMNQVMHDQQNSSKKPLRHYHISDDSFDIAHNEYEKKNEWRLFQIAFILMNIKGLVDPNSQDRDIADLIWFSTGGGKTEAYLGLSSFMIIYRRLINNNNYGISVLMRYTLRLLSSQQFTRAASMFCSLENLRVKTPELGDKPFSLGLWVGANVTPPDYATAREKLNNLMDKGGDNPFIMIKCPWCGCEMGFFDNGEKGSKKRKKVIGYECEKNSFKYKCDNPDCLFSKIEMPVRTIDEAIYNDPPDMLISTVDKFALLPWNKKTRNLFNLHSSNDSIDIIIQDELHLINGSLGTVIGIYEILIQSLIEKKGSKPKVIASTATISRYKEHLISLFNRKNAMIFPLPICRFGETFFSYEDEKSSGRLYIGIVPSSSITSISSQIHLTSFMLHCINSLYSNNENDLKSIDFYWTLLLYFNTIKELGYISYQLDTSIKDRTNVLYNQYSEKIKKYFNHDLKKRSYLKKSELTSRVKSQDIPKVFDSLNNSIIGNEQETVDICLGTNMISVGIDVQRLGLMLIFGHPKLTSEYIQCSSRVGRNENGPGLVVTLYNSSRNRDMSVYENFQGFHSRIYSYVEASTITPYSITAQKRLLHAIMVGFERLLKDSDSPLIDIHLLKELKVYLEERTNEISESEKDIILSYFENNIKKWELFMPERYGDFFSIKPDSLFSPANSDNYISNDSDKVLWSMPTSMRVVEKECEIRLYSGDE